jgi:hypothetical protein
MLKRTHKATVKLFLCLTKHYAMKGCGEGKVAVYSFLVPVLDGSEWPASTARPANSGESASGNPLNRRLGGSLRRNKNILPSPGIEPRSQEHPARCLVTIPTELSRIPKNTFKNHSRNRQERINLAQEMKQGRVLFNK